MDEFQNRHFQLGLLPCKESQEQEKYEKEIKDKSYKIDYNHHINETAWKCYENLNNVV